MKNGWFYIFKILDKTKGKSLIFDTNVLKIPYFDSKFFYCERFSMSVFRFLRKINSFLNVIYIPIFPNK